MNLEFKGKLPIPKQVKRRFPISETAAKIKAKRDEEIKNVFLGKSDKFILIIGPCSADYSKSVLDYIEKLKRVDEQTKDKLIIIPRIYTNKPRTTGAGYKGMLHQPSPEHKPNMLEGIIAIRELHMSALNDYGFSCADEMLYPDNHRYLSDLLSYVAVGARSVENQQHRLTASGLNLPVGMKNPTSGDLNVMMNAVLAAKSSHTFIYRGWEVESKGNPLAHAILRGYTDLSGRCVSNYHYETLNQLSGTFDEYGIENKAVIIDTNHANSNKQFAEQPRIAADVLYSMAHNNHIKTLVKGLMIESYLEDGCQKIGGGVYGQSITDPCIGWEKTEKLILKIADSL